MEAPQTCFSNQLVWKIRHFTNAHIRLIGKTLP